MEAVHPRPVRTAHRSLLVSLITEGTFPFHHGGVAVWCDQIVRGLAPHRYQIVAVTAGPDEEVQLALPDNVSELRLIPLWDINHRGRSTRVGRRMDPNLRDALRTMLMAIATNDAEHSFLASLEQIYRTAADGRFLDWLHTNDAVRLTLEAMCATTTDGRIRGDVPNPTIADAVAVLGLFEHLLRPLAVAPPNVDLCHASSNGVSALLAMTAKWEHGTPLLLTEHGIYLRERYIEYSPHSMMPHARRSFLLGFYKRITSAAYDMADAIAPCSDYNRRWEQANGADLDKIKPIHNGIDPDEFGDTAAEPEAPTLVWVGRIDPLKDVKTLLRAFARVKAEIPGAVLRIYGGTPVGNERYLSECLDLHELLGLGDSAVFEGHTKSMNKAYLSGHIVVATSISEGFPYAVLEAMASGRAMIATDVGGVWEAIDSAGILVPPQDDEALAKACIDLLRNPARRTQLATMGRDRVRARFMVDLCLERYSELYDDLVDAAATPATAGSDKVILNPVHGGPTTTTTAGDLAMATGGGE